MAHHLQREIDHLKKRILALSAVVEESVQMAVQAVVQRDERLAQRVLQADSQIDHEEVEIEEDCLKILALYQPVAVDLRFIISVLKINGDLERIGDLSGNIAERAAALAVMRQVDSPINFGEMGRKTLAMLRKSLDALIGYNKLIARDVIASDDEIDDMLRTFYKGFPEVVARDPDFLEPMLSMLTATRSLERIADYATNIAEDIIYMIEGEIIRHRAISSAAHLPTGIKN